MDAPDAQTAFAAATPDLGGAQGPGAAEVPTVPGRRWTPVQTNARAEKVVAAACRRLGIAHFLPLRSAVHRYGRRVVSFELPLFPGYLFCALDDESRLALLRTRRVVRTLVVHDDGPLVAALGQLARMSAARLPIEPHPYVAVGRRVLITEGPLAGLEGLVVARRNKHRLVVNIDLLRQAAAVTLDPTHVRDAAAAEALP